MTADRPADRAKGEMMNIEPTGAEQILLPPDIREYFMRIEAAIQAHVKLPLTEVCPDCGEWIATVDGDHVTVLAPFDGASKSASKLAVVIGCEGYWTINPELVGLPHGNWQPA